MRNAIRTAVACGLFFVAGDQLLAQAVEPAYVSDDVLLNNYRKATTEDQLAPLRTVRDPAKSDFVAVADRALKNVEQIRRNRRLTESKLVEFLDNDIGRWVASNQTSFKVFVSFDFDSIEFSDAGIDDRLVRLKLAKRSLETSKGPLSDADREVSNILLADATWIEQQGEKLKSRLAILTEFEREFPADRDWSSFPTLRQQKDARRAQLNKVWLAAQLEGFESARAKAIENVRTQAYKNESERIDLEEAEKRKLAELNRRLIESEFAVKLANTREKIAKNEIRREKVESARREALESAQERKVKAYLQTPRVKNLLAPFCGAGRTLAREFQAGPRYDEKNLEPGPMSHSRLTRLIAFRRKGEADELDYLTSIGNDSLNDRPVAWPIPLKGWRDAGKDFQNMDGQLVNRYVEAYRIIKNHGAVLVELGMLRP